MYPGGTAFVIIANAFSENIEFVVGGIIVAVGAGVFLALFNQIMGNFGDELNAFKEDVDGRFDRMEAEVKEVQAFRTEFLSKGWLHLPPGMADGPAMAATMARMDAKLDAIDAKADQVNARLDAHDQWERRQKYPRHVTIEGEMTSEPVEPDKE